jgi:hypothetical protein
MGTGRSEAHRGGCGVGTFKVNNKLLLLLLSDFRNSVHVALGYRLSDRKVMCKATAQLCILLVSQHTWGLDSTAPSCQDIPRRWKRHLSETWDLEV